MKFIQFAIDYFEKDKEHVIVILGSRDCYDEVTEHYSCMSMLMNRRDTKFPCREWCHCTGDEARSEGYKLKNKPYYDVGDTCCVLVFFKDHICSRTDLLQLIDDTKALHDVRYNRHIEINVVIDKTGAQFSNDDFVNTVSGKPVRLAVDEAIRSLRDSVSEVLESRL